MSPPIEKGKNNDTSTDLSSLIMQVGSTWAVKSNPNEPFFRVFIDINNIIISCDCLAFIARRVPCSHMCMLKWYNKGVIVAPPNQPFQLFQPPPQPYLYPQQSYPFIAPQPSQQPVMQPTFQPIQQAMEQSATQPARQPIQQPVSSAQSQPPLTNQAPRKSQAMPTKSTKIMNPTLKRSANPSMQPIAKRAQKTTQASSSTQHADSAAAANKNPDPIAQPKTTQPSPRSQKIQQRLHMEMQQHLEQSQLQKSQAKKARKTPDRERNLGKLIAMLTELNTQYGNINPSSSASPPSLPPYINADIAQRGKKIALEAQAAIQSGLRGEALKKVIADMLNKGRQDVANNPSISTASSSSSNTTSFAKSSTTTADSLPTATPSATPRKIACKGTTFSASVSTTVSTNATPSLPATATAAIPLSSSPDPAKTPATSTSPESSSLTGKRRRTLPTFAMSSFLRNTQEAKQPEEKLIKAECSMKSHKYPVVEPIEGFNAAIERMINNMNSEKNSASDPWSISSSDEDDDDDNDNKDKK
ncbi:hypothetical protein BD408DRAFT_439716 [Parasitella parasitica]|nr:hypothetical protein BD408DRAFT_439716 [Parasitella parasitica]